MSKIRDALRKAEQEKAAGSSVPDAPQTATATRRREPEPPGLSAGDPRICSSPAGVLDGSTSPDLLASLLERWGRTPWEPDRKTMLLFNRRFAMAGLEKFLTLRSNLDLIRRRSQLHTLLITSALREEGKTFVAANLGQAIARQPERRVLLVDADLREPSMHVYLGAPSTPGLTDYLDGTCDAISIIQRGPVGSLFFIPSGKQSRNASELIASSRLKLLLKRVAPVFDWVIIDSPPVIPVTDAKLLAELCDGVVVVVRAGLTPFDLAQRACQEFGKERRLGIVLNCADRGSTYSFPYEGQTQGGPG